MGAPQIVGIVLVRNEDLHVERAVRNVAGFCDKIFLCDHGSRDETPTILARLVSEFSHASLHLMNHPRESHDLLKPFCGTNTWIFGVDGDEIYDPQKLVIFRNRIRSGEFERVWRMKGNVLHCTALGEGVAKGFTAPPSRSITKLYNFSAIRAWDGDTVERLHGGQIDFCEGWNDSMKRNLQDEEPWGKASLRCLHLCFLQRSSLDKPGTCARANIMETYGSGWRGTLNRLFGFFDSDADSRWKKSHYCKGPEVTVDASPFFPE
jgi:hypothetical protein